MTGETPVIKAMRAILEENLQPVLLEIRDDSARHVGHAGYRPGGGTHFHINIISQKFRELSRVERHRMVYAMLDEFFKSGVHALSLKALAPDEALRT